MSAAVAVAVTEARAEDGHTRVWGSVVCAALALPGLAAAQGEPGPGPGLVAFKWLSYQDWQPGLKRVGVQAPSLLVRAPLGERWGVEGSLTSDSVSGASPRWHSAVSSASKMSDLRRAGDVKVTRYENRSAWALGLAASTEHDFSSRAASAEGRWSSDDNNRTWNAGVGYTQDHISSTNNPELDEKRRTLELTGGITQVLTRLDIVQAAITHARGHGYYADPYKSLDVRPASRYQTITTLRWNHHLEAADATLRSNWRYYSDSFGVRSHTLGLEAVVAAGDRLSITPSVRLYSQTAASFYYDPVYSYIGEPFPPGYFEAPPAYLSPDQRLAAFGAVTLGLKIAWKISEEWSTDFKLERYEQRSGWKWSGHGSPGLAAFSARFVQWGLARRF